MNYFLNYKDGDVTVNTYRAVGAQATDINDILRAVREDSEEILCASIGDDCVETAQNWSEWQEKVDPDGFLKKQEFDNMTMEDKIHIIVECFRGE